MRNIFVLIDRSGKATTDTKQLGYSGEHNAAILTFSFAEDAADIYSPVDYFRVVIDGHYSHELHLSDGRVVYSVPQECMRPPRAQCQLVGYVIDGDEPKTIVKSQVFSFDVDRSEVPFKTVDTHPDILEQAMELCRSSAEIAKEGAETAVLASQTAKTSAETALIYGTQAKQSAELATKSAEELSQKNIDLQNLSNALKGSASGSVVAVKDVSPLEHKVKVTLSGDLPEGEQVLTKTETVSTKGATVILNTPAESVRVVIRGGAYTVSGIVPTVSGDDLTALDDFRELAIVPVFSYGEVGAVCDLVYTVSGNTLSWVGTREINAEGYDVEPEEISGSYTLSTSGQKITGFCQVYGLDEDNPNADNPQYDHLDTVVEVYEGSASSVNLSVYGKNLLTDKKVFLTGGNIYFGVTAYTQGVPLKKGTYTFSLVSDVVATGMYIFSGDGKDKLVEDFSKKNRFTFTLTEDMSVRIRAYSGSFKSADDVVSAQLEVGSSATEYEPYVEPTVYPVNTDGTVEGVKSVYPSMTFVPDTDGVNIEVEYNRDINKAITEIQKVIAQLQGLAVATTPLNGEDEV